MTKAELRNLIAAQTPNVLVRKMETRHAYGCHELNRQKGGMCGGATGTPGGRAKSIRRLPHTTASRGFRVASK